MIRNREDLTLFLHIPKTGGNSLRRLFYYNTADSEFLDLLVGARTDASGTPLTVESDHPEMNKFIEAVRSPGDVSVAAANLPFGVHRALPQRQVKYITFLREPVSRARSYWKFVYRNRDVSKVWASWSNLDFDLSRILQDPSGTGLVNEQVRMAAGVARLHLGQRDLEVAASNLENAFAFVGDFDFYERDVHRLGALLGWTYMDIPRVNVAPRSSEDGVPESFDSEVLRANEFDISLYSMLKSGRFE